MLYVVTPLSKPLGGSLDVNASVASQTPEDFTEHLEMHLLKHIIHLIFHGATCMRLILQLKEEQNLRQLHLDTKSMNLQVILLGLLWQILVVFVMVRKQGISAFSQYICFSGNGHSSMR